MQRIKRHTADIWASTKHSPSSSNASKSSDSVKESRDKSASATSVKRSSTSQLTELARAHQQRAPLPTHLLGACNRRYVPREVAHARPHFAHGRRHSGQMCDAGLLHHAGSSIRRPATHHPPNKNQSRPHAHPRGRRRCTTKSTTMDTHTTCQAHHNQRAAPT